MRPFGLITKKSNLLSTIVLLLLSIWCISSCSTKKDERPNVMIIFPDQYRQFSLGFWSQGDNARFLQGAPDPVYTPALDRLANQGIVFSRAVSNYPLCSPFRGMLLSGMYPDQNGLTTNCRADREVSLREDIDCITDVYANAGYNVAYFGKCHWQKTEPLFDENGNYTGSTAPPGGHYVNRYDTYVPPGRPRHGIDYFFQALKDEHFNPRVYSSDPLAIDGKKDGELHLPRRFSSELESEVIVDYLSNTHGQRDPDKPFLLIWSLNPPHNPWNEKSTYMEFFKQYSEQEGISSSDLLKRENADSAIGHYAPYYFANVTAVDHFIGNVLDHLDELGLAENTIITFTSDHGEMLGSHGRTGKNVAEAEAFLIPFIVKWGNKLDHRIEEEFVNVPDVMPTLLSLSGLEAMIPPEVQGNDLSPMLMNPASGIKKANGALFINANSRGVYTGKYMFVVRAVEGAFDQAYYYDNEVDPYQLHQLSDKELSSEMLKKLKQQLYTLLADTEDSWYTQGICKDYFASVQK